MARAQAVSPQVESCNVYLPHPSIAPWVEGFIDECSSFPNAKYGDQVDRMTQVLNRLRGTTSPTFALGGHFLCSRQKIPFAFNVGTAKIGENRLGEDLASFLRDPSLACCC